jgi:hypothetical protein
MAEEAKKKAQALSEDSTEPSDAKVTEEKKEDGGEEKDKEEKSDKQKPLPGNGGVAPNYWWQ